MPYQNNAGPSRPQPAPAIQQQPTAAPTSSSPSLEELVKQMAQNSLSFQQRAEASIQNLETQIGQLATSVNQLQS